MSRTVRTHEDGRYYVNGNYYDWREFKTVRWYESPRMLGYHYDYYLNRNDRDKKPWNKPPKHFKQMKRRLERAKVKNALRCGKEPPIFPKSDVYEWT